MCQINRSSLHCVKRNDFNSHLSFPDYTKTAHDIVHRAANSVLYERKFSHDFLVCSLDAVHACAV